MHLRSALEPNVNTLYSHHDMGNYVLRWVSNSYRLDAGVSHFNGLA